VKYQGKEAKPKDVRVSLGEVARLKDMDRSIVAEQTTANASQFFGIPFQT
jgi:Tat protein secretion system quality control protein TatD with DNase activity